MTTLRRLYVAALAFFALVVMLGVLLPRGRPRSWQTAGFAGMAAASAIYAAAALPYVLLFRPGRRAGLRRGTFEVEPDEERRVEGNEAFLQMEQLAPTRQAAFDALLDQPPLACDACGTRCMPEIVGRVGKRILRRSEEPFDVLGEGWWWAPTPPSPCATCALRSNA